MKISQRNAKLCLDNRNKIFPVEMALVETPQILEAETAAQILDYNQRVAPIFADKAMAKNLIRRVISIPVTPFGMVRWEWSVGSGESGNVELLTLTRSCPYNRKRYQRSLSFRKYTIRNGAKS
jgi:hypothetical protein